MSDNLRIWDAVSKTNPAHTKKVNQRGGFTAISASYQILAATKQFGPIGIGWGYTTGDPIIVETLVMVPVTLWHGDRAQTFGPMLGCEEWKDGKGRIDSDAPKKAVTDGLTKLLSQLGFNADVFLGKFDDSKYVEEVRREFEEAERAANDPPVNEQQYAEITTLIQQSGSDTKAFLKYYDIPTVNELRQSRFEHARAMLNKKLKEAA